MALALLVVDDSPIVRSMLIRTLQASGLPATSIHQAPDIDGAFAILASAPVDVALVDQALPIDDGSTFLERLREDPRLARLPVVMVIPPDAPPGTAADVAACGAVPLRAPFTPEGVRAAVLRSRSAPTTGPDTPGTARTD